MSSVVCPHCGHRHEADAAEIIETRTLGVTEDWEAWTTVTCERCGAEYMYRTE